VTPLTKQPGRSENLLARGGDVKHKQLSPPFWHLERAPVDAGVSFAASAINDATKGIRDDKKRTSSELTMLKGYHPTHLSHVALHPTVDEDRARTAKGRVTILAPSVRWVGRMLKHRVGDGTEGSKWLRHRWLLPAGALTLKPLKCSILLPDGTSRGQSWKHKFVPRMP
jgi:hypothetical protein